MENTPIGIDMLATVVAVAHKMDEALEWVELTAMETDETYEPCIRVTGVDRNAPVKVQLTAVLGAGEFLLDVLPLDGTRADMAAYKAKLYYTQWFKDLGIDVF